MTVISIEILLLQFIVMSVNPQCISHRHHSGVLRNLENINVFSKSNAIALMILDRHFLYY